MDPIITLYMIIVFPLLILVALDGLGFKIYSPDKIKKEDKAFKNLLSLLKKSEVELLEMASKYQLMEVRKKRIEASLVAYAKLLENDSRHIDFDQRNPSQQAIKDYYNNALKELIKTIKENDKSIGPCT